MTAPTYPRIAHLVAGRGSRDDLTLDSSQIEDLLSSEVVVEEKIDGANVTISAGTNGYPRAGLRSGDDSLDRGRQLGPLRAWLSEHESPLRDVLEDWAAIYGEWMLVTHTVNYDRLPSYLVVLDLWKEDAGFATVDERDDACRRAGLYVPPRLWRGSPGNLARVEGLLGESCWGPGLAEGLVVRRVGRGEPRLAKLVRPGFDRVDDADWRAGRPRNRLAEGQVSWR